MRAHLSKQGHQIALGETIIYMSKFLGDSAGGKKRKVLTSPPPAPTPSVHINLLGAGEGRPWCLRGSWSFSLGALGVI